MTRTKLRVLALCGIAQTADIFRQQLAPLQETCTDVEFVFLEPPIILKPADFPPVLKLVKDTPLETSLESAENVHRAWWVFDKDYQGYQHFDETVTYVHDYLLRHPPFDGVMGFSQGGVMASLLCAMIDKPHLHPNFPADPSINQFKFMIAASSFVPFIKAHLAPQFLPYYPLPSSLVTLHIAGAKDSVIPQEETRFLASRCLDSRLEIHPGGHYWPLKPEWKTFISTYMSSFHPGGTKGQGVESPSTAIRDSHDLDPSLSADRSVSAKL
ncbi:hypothetical protein CI109_100912 [Kwoniella shandongensis]|uniref:Uncharacterized protein n=1 Tax=Kwoniella shandongensis TaxID=1734106 RepID=A0A5M6C4E0_9TREE|nr:uncharacterized protein CI109_001378 [Kwoniella shandongensis]KAA5529976.1 hypothetical protein CI109_001378 [Kwoniella shandongensis]